MTTPCSRLLTLVLTVLLAQKIDVQDGASTVQRNCTSAADQVASAGKSDGEEEAAAPLPRRRRHRGRPSDR